LVSVSKNRTKINFNLGFGFGIEIKHKPSFETSIFGTNLFWKENETKGQLDLEINWYLTIDFKLCHPKLDVSEHLTISYKLNYLELDQN
jgi:hypothetical protein